MTQVEITPASAARPAPMPIEIESLLRWTYAPGRLGGPPWREAASLSLDGGLTARPRRRPRVSWAEAEACAGLRFGARSLRMTATADPDAAIVAAEVRKLPARMASLIVTSARVGMPPNWRDTVKLLQPDWRDAAAGVPWIAFADTRRRQHPYCRLRVVVEVRATAESRERYRLWREGLIRLVKALDGALTAWRVKLSRAPAEPWREGAVANKSSWPVFVAGELSASFLLWAGACPGPKRPAWKRVTRPWWWR